ncbi:hypothetical protein CWR48_13960 [Oceanobacillus arenosus]|uniref:Uncharacterized protein n=1 Tax=Oceanobacillus arenosus TaxID=1229153 RepID=A0A3D8PPZ4_9BACI|nr:hypothetical protein [Oceanobacillus arenosus]RDW17617.1 hypothetical protein CWR48_13960 [Oceanobacillus arenosus]
MSERLESVRNSLKALELNEILKFVNEQAERVEELEKHLETTERHLKDFRNFEFEERTLKEKAQEQNIRYKQALEEIKQIAVYYNNKGWALNPDKIGEIVVKALKGEAE